MLFFITKIMINEYSDELTETPFKRNFGKY